MRILVDHSGYALQNIGDIAMLQACISRLRSLWPDATIDVITESVERLARYCPGTTPVSATVTSRGPVAALPPRARLGGEQLWKMAAPLVAGAGRRTGAVGGSGVVPAIRRADVVVSSGGGFINDAFWWHGFGVLSVLAMAQRLGKPTAMFGQGIGPLTNPVLRHLLRAVLPRLAVLGLREGVGSLPEVRIGSVVPESVVITGDDALLLATPPTRPVTGSRVGMNIRAARYSGMTEAAGRNLIEVIERAAHCHGAGTVALPVEYNSAASDLRIVGSGRLDGTPEQLIRTTASCRVVATGSYHAAVFALAAGVPVVCITNSAYYDGKFRGLAALFPGGCQIVRGGPDFGRDLTHALAQAWRNTESDRDEIHRSALRQVATADAAYQRFAGMVEDALRRVRA
jgi:colanic acid/amylovoran biosynthesis protein